ncbi:MAG: response regulator transcription factor [Siphonobacter aquaeclarae]|nr:response regulator transcription factor [Siphonobacter aquaeclarae]
MLSSKKSIAIADDHVLFRKGIVSLIRLFPEYEVLMEASDGKELIGQIKPGRLPDIALLDISMPNMDGFSTAQWLQANYPQVRIIALSTMDSEAAIIRMIRNGATGYVMKDAEPEELKQAFDEVIKNGYFYNEQITRKVMKSITIASTDGSLLGLTKLTERELEFLKLVCTEKSYQEIAADMFVSPRTVEGYRNALCEKLQLKTRTGLVLYAIKNGIVVV